MLYTRGISACSYFIIDLLIIFLIKYLFALQNKNS